MFVMVTDDGQNQTQGMKRLADVFAGDGMQLHDLPFRWSEIASFLQYLVRDSNLPEVVEVPTAFERENGILIHTEMTAKVGGVNGKALAVAFSVGIAAFNDQTKRAEDGISSLQLVGKLLQAEEGLHPS